MEEKLELADQKVAQLSKLPEVQHELTQVNLDPSERMLGHCSRNS